jgi:polyketide cyclase/dehydrase/lipid transport protein
MRESPRLHANYRLAMAYPTAATRDIAAPAVKLWELVSDLPRMGDWSPENQGGKWIKGASGPSLGAVFKGSNKNGFRRWSTNATVVACDPGKVFEFAVTSGPLAIASWRYEFEDTASGCRVTESWEDKRKPWFVTVARVLGDHGAAHAEQEMAATLANLAAAVE